MVPSAASPSPPYRVPPLPFRYPSFPPLPPAFTAHISIHRRTWHTTLSRARPSITIIVTRGESLSGIRGPARDLDKVGHEGRDVALEDRRVPADHVLLAHRRLVELLDH